MRAVIPPGLVTSPAGPRADATAQNPSPEGRSMSVQAGDSPRQSIGRRMEQVPLSLLSAVDSPRLAGIDEEHLRLLVQTAAELPPILVHRDTLRVIDGVHRLRAAVLRGDQSIAVQFLDGSPDEAFVLGVQVNAQHGLPLSLADRKAAAARILDAFPAWSDRAVARVAGLSAATVATLRIVPEAGSAGRLGQDGRVRPTDMSHRRRLASEMIAREPGASLRQVATACGISPMTVRDVRARMMRGEDPVPKPQRAREAGVARPDPPRPDESPRPVRREPDRSPEEGTGAILRGLRSDPSLRFTEHGRALLRWLTPRVSGPHGWSQFDGQVPPHSHYALADLARACAREWLEFAERLEEGAVAPGARSEDRRTAA
ncbi:transcriptional regulator protein [Catenuloplanes sp. NPDC051500]|uniref:transcriptional regulator protein n=1 Tax=Catenuloplanes sp. NPDC051500 TaxID=3363959 RepID=UPI0037B4E853